MAQESSSRSRHNWTLRRSSCAVERGKGELSASLRSVGLSVVAGAVSIIAVVAYQTTRVRSEGGKRDHPFNTETLPEAVPAETARNDSVGVAPPVDVPFSSTEVNVQFSVAVVLLAVLTAPLSGVGDPRPPSESSVGSVAIYDPDPNHIWNRLHAVFFVRSIRQDLAVYDALDFPFWYHARRTCWRSLLHNKAAARSR